MFKGHAALCLLLILVLLGGCGAQIDSIVPDAASGSPAVEIPPLPTPTPLLSPPPPVITPTPRVYTPSRRTGTAQLPAQRHFFLQHPADPEAEAGAAETLSPAETYTVDRGECLWTIAEGLYGTGTAWDRLWAANRDALPDPGFLRVGQVLQLPPTDD